MRATDPGRPEVTEYPTYAAAYVNLVPAGNIIDLLDKQIGETTTLLRSADPELAYAPGKWTVKQVVGHVVDTERIFAYRALRIARNDSAPSPGFEQDDYVRYGPFAQCSLADLLEEFRLVRASSIALYNKLDPEAWQRTGVANQFPVSVRGIAYLTAGHELHHAKILREKYLAA